MWADRLPVSAARDVVEEHRLVRRAQRGDSAAFAELVRLNQDRIYGLALRMVGADAAEDLAQQTFIKAWQALGRFDGKAGFGTWLYRIAINACLDHLRRRDRARPLPLEEATWAGPDGDDVADQVTDAAEQAERRTALAWALEHLSAEDRLLLYLRVAEERSYEAIAELLGINSRTVGTRLYRIRARLHQLISNRCGSTGAETQSEGVEEPSGFPNSEVR